MFDMSSVAAQCSAGQLVDRPRPSGPVGNTKPPKFDYVGVGSNAPILTALGFVSANQLRRGQRIRTNSGTYKEILAVERVDLDEKFLTEDPKAQPIVIRAGSLGNKLPETDIQLARNQKFMPGQPLMRPGIKSAADALRHAHSARGRAERMSYIKIYCSETASANCSGIWLYLSDANSS